MKIPTTHRWDVTPQEAMQIQNELAGRVIEQNELRDTCTAPNARQSPQRSGVGVRCKCVRTVAGVDVGLEGEGNQIMRAAVVVLKFPELVPLDYAVARLPVAFPYVPGLLAFREIPVVLRALEQLKTEPDLLIVDGHGRAHPRRMGIACHLGVLLDRATIGCAKSILCGVAKEPKDKVGAWTPLVDRKETIGAALRTRIGTKPVYISVGHKVNLEIAIGFVLKCCTRYRVPETTRFAHRVAGGEELDLSKRQLGLL